MTAADDPAQLDPETLPASPGNEFIGRRIAVLRRAKNLTQEQLAAECGVSRSAVALWEMGKISHRGAAIRHVAEVLGISAEKLAFEGDPEFSKVLNEAEEELIRLFRQSEPEHRVLLLQLAEAIKD